MAVQPPTHFKKMVGEKVYLSPMTPDDADRYTAWMNDPEVAQYINTKPYLQTLLKQKSIMQRMASTDIHSFAVIDNESDKLIGNCGLYAINNIHRTAELGVMIGETSYWGRGYGRDAVKLLLDFGFNILNLHSIMLKTLSINERAIKSFEYAGFKRAGVIRESRKIAGTLCDWVYMDILASEFQSPYVKNVWEKARTGERPHQISLAD